MKRVLAVFVVALVAAAGAVLVTLPVHAASQGVGFGTWAPISEYGWHGSMLIDGVHTYCITPGRPAPTGSSTDQGVSGLAAGLSPQQLTGINLLVSKYGQTDDPVQAASVGWAVKAIADWDETLHAFGYPGDSLPGAIHWTFSALAPESDAAVQARATEYYAEATGIAAGFVGGSGTVVFTTDSEDQTRGTVTVRTDVAAASGSLTLEHAVFADTGSPTRDGISGGVAYAITAAAPDNGAFRVRGSGDIHGGYQAAVRHYSTEGGQDTAGPVGTIEFAVAGEDAADRQTTFAPVITTAVVSRYVAGGRFVDDVTFASARNPWGRAGDGGYASITATGTVYRTAIEPVVGIGIPPGAEPIGSLRVTTVTATGPTIAYRVESDAPLPGPGFYTAVWQIRADAQTPDVQRMLDAGYEWTEPFGEQSQITMVSAISSHAEPTVAVGATMSDEIVIDGFVPAGGVDVTASVYRAADGVAPADACSPGTLVWTSAPLHLDGPGSTTVTAPRVPDFGTYYWRERALDAQGRLIHEGGCGLADETTKALVPTVTTHAAPSPGFGGLAIDVATVAGAVPATGSTTLTFALYRWADGVDAGSACTAGSLVGDTRALPVVVTGAGDYTSPAIRTTTAGTYFWIEYLWFTPEGSTETKLLAQGACGAADETVVIGAPAITTAATERAPIGMPFTDSATVDGLGHDVEVELVFFAYRNRIGTVPTCSSETLDVQTSPMRVRGDGTYVSPEVSADRLGDVHWVAELRYRPAPDAAPVVIHRGVCGEHHESTRIESLAATGYDDSGLSPKQLGAIGAGMASLGFALCAVFAPRSRRPRP